MEKLDIVWRIVEILVAAVSASVLTRIFTVRERVKQEKSNTEKADAEAKKDQIDNIRKTMEEVYKPIIDDLRKAVEEARSDADKACQRVNDLEDKVDVLERENRELKRENAMLKEIVHEINPELVASKRRESAKRQASEQPRSANGQFTKREYGYNRDEKS